MTTLETESPRIGSDTRQQRRTRSKKAATKQTAQPQQRRGRPKGSSTKSTSTPKPIVFEDFVRVKFLNKSSLTNRIFTGFDNDGYCFLKIADCHRMITIHGDCKPKKVETMLFTLDTIIDETKKLYDKIQEQSSIIPTLEENISALRENSMRKRQFGVQILGRIFRLNVPLEHNELKRTLDHITPFKSVSCLMPPSAPSLDVIFSTIDRYGNWELNIQGVETEDDSTTVCLHGTLQDQEGFDYALYKLKTVLDEVQHLRNFIQQQYNKKYIQMFEFSPNRESLLPPTLSELLKH